MRFWKRRRPEITEAPPTISLTVGPELAQRALDIIEKQFSDVITDDNRPVILVRDGLWGINWPTGPEGWANRAFQVPERTYVDWVYQRALRNGMPKNEARAEAEHVAYLVWPYQCPKGIYPVALLPHLLALYSR